MSDQLEFKANHQGIPDKIYLQAYGTDCLDDDELDEFIDITMEVSWCWDRIFDSDIEYIRMDLHKAEIESLRAELKALRSPQRANKDI